MEENAIGVCVQGVCWRYNVFVSWACTQMHIQGRWSFVGPRVARVAVCAPGPSLGLRAQPARMPCLPAWHMQARTLRRPTARGATMATTRSRAGPMWPMGERPADGVLPRRRCRCLCVCWQRRTGPALPANLCTPASLPLRAATPTAAPTAAPPPSRQTLWSSSVWRWRRRRPPPAALQGRRQPARSARLLPRSRRRCGSSTRGARRSRKTSSCGLPSRRRSGAAPRRVLPAGGGAAQRCVGRCWHL